MCADFLIVHDLGFSQVLEILFLNLALPDASVLNYDSDDEDDDDVMDVEEGSLQGNAATNEVRLL